MENLILRKNETVRESGQLLKSRLSGKWLFGSGSQLPEIPFIRNCNRLQKHSMGEKGVSDPPMTAGDAAVSPTLYLGRVGDQGKGEPVIGGFPASVALAVCEHHGLVMLVPGREF